MERYDKQPDSFLGTKGSGVQIFKYFPAGSHINMPPWRNWLARSAVNRKVGGSSPPGGAIIFTVFLLCFDKGFVIFSLLVQHVTNWQQ